MLPVLADRDPSPSQGRLVPTAGHDSLRAGLAADGASQPPAGLLEGLFGAVPVCRLALPPQEGPWVRDGVGGGGQGAGWVAAPCTRFQAGGW